VNSLNQKASATFGKQGSQEASSWLFKPKPRPKAELKLFCFAYAGGNANIFRNWTSSLDPRIELNAIQLPGRAARFKEPLLDSMQAILDALEQALTPEFDKGEFAFFGHSMGASIAFELARILQAKQKRLPKRVIVSGRRAPSLPIKEDRKSIHDLPKQEFIEQLKNLNGTPNELLEHEDLMELMEPILRSDFKVIETWKYQQSEPLNTPLSIFSGFDDEHVSERSLAAWSKESKYACESVIFPGDHFYLKKYEIELVDKINNILL
jgi:medium-chain acyl-[acyl-carrier-protein] hydrolase